MDAVAVLEQQHDDIARRLEEAAASERAPTRDRDVRALLRQVRAHVVAERVHLYRACRARFPVPGADLVDAVAAHERTSDMARALAASTAPGAAFDAHLRRLHRAFRDHAAHDERRLHQRAKTWLCEEELDAIGDAIRATYRVLVATGRGTGW